jgi:glutamate dehydrogenase/leucine dehydrogenase
MALQKLENANAFVVRDLDTEAPAIGIVRSAPKILQGGAKELARSQTYQLAILEMQHQGASCGVNAAPDERDDTMAAFCAELLTAVQSGSLMLSAAKGVSDEQMSTLNAADARSDIRLNDIDGISNTAHLTGLGAVACASAARSLDGAKIAIENFDDVGLAVARAAAAAGAKITAISTSAGAAMSDDGFDVGALATTMRIDGPGMVATLSDEELPFWRILGADVDVLFAGSKAGLIDHKNGENLKASVLVPTGPIPYTTKGALTIERQGVTVLPDFVTTAGGLLAGFPDSDDQAAVESGITTRLQALTESILGKDASPILEACFQAEAFLKTWRDELPFGRPFA